MSALYEVSGEGEFKFKSMEPQNSLSSASLLIK